jgi:hypothetical protein
MAGLFNLPIPKAKRIGIGVLQKKGGADKKPSL